jgi:hypothetical protein
MTILAYTALLAYEKATDQLLANRNMQPLQPMIVVPHAPLPEEGPV